LKRVILMSKPIRIICHGLGVIGLSAILLAQETNTTAPVTSQPKPTAVSATPASVFTDQQIVETWGWIIAQNQKVAGIEIKEGELSGFLKGFSAGVRGQPSPYDSQKVYPDVERLAKARRKQVVHVIEQKNEVAARAFLEGLKLNPGVVELPGGARYEIIKRGSGPLAKPQQTVNVHYTGRLINGEEFTQFGPLDLVLVPNRSVCRGWFDAVQKLNKSSVIKLYVPPPLLEDEALQWGIPPGSMMVFEIELLDIKETSAQDLENALIPPAPDLEPPPPSGYGESQLFECWGWNVARDARTDKCELSDTEISWLANGLAAGIKGEPLSVSPQGIDSVLGKFVADRRERTRNAVRRKQFDEMDRFFAGLKANTNVVELPDGLRYEIIHPGGGPYPKPGQIVLVDYTARLINGTVFDKTYNEPLHIQVGSVIPGWNEGIQKINKGGKIKLYVSPSLGYGDEDSSGVVAPIPANSTLIYDIELLDIQDAPEDTTAPSPAKQ
jgi:peptidylprolyl isomerase